jgi:hypothetical protein
MFDKPSSEARLEPIASIFLMPFHFEQEDKHDLLRRSWVRPY